MKVSLVPCLFVEFAVLSSAHAQVIVAGGQDASAKPETSSVPTFGIFWSASGKLPPSPFDPLPQLPLYQYGPTGDDQYIYDDRDFDYRSFEQSAVSEATSASTPTVSMKQSRVKRASASHPMFEFLNGVPGLVVKVQGTNATLTWPSSTGNLYLIESETDLLKGLSSGGGVPWTVLTNALLAAAGTETSFIDPNPVIYPTNSSGTNGGGGGGPPPPGGGTNSGSGGTDTSTARFYVVYNVTPITGQPIFTVSEGSSANQLNIFKMPSIQMIVFSTFRA